MMRVIGGILDLTKRVSKALRKLKLGGTIRSAIDNKGNVMWSIHSEQGTSGPEPLPSP